MAAVRSVIPFLFLLVCSCQCSADPVPTPWPEQFHALMYTNYTGTGKLVIDDLWYDLPNGRNFNILQRQLSDVLYDLEWDNGTSFFYTLGPGGTCRQATLPVGIVRPDFLSDATYLGRVSTDGFLCDLWQKLDFIWYYEDVATKRPVRWDFFTGMSMHAITFEVGAVLPDPQWQAPAYCFPQAGAHDDAAAAAAAAAADDAPIGSLDMFRRLSLLSRPDAPSHISQGPKTGKIREASL